MVTQTQTQVTLDNSETRTDKMEQLLTGWIDDLVTLTNEARKSDQFQEWLDAQSRFHDYSYRNTLLIKRQRPNATKVAGYNTWQEQFDRYVTEGEKAIWIWAPIVRKQCPECGNSPKDHNATNCEFDEAPSDKWTEGVIGFKPVPVFDISQTEGEPLPQLDTDAVGDATGLIQALLAAAETLDVEASVVPSAKWNYGEAKGVCTQRSPTSLQPLVEAKAQSNRADLAVTLIHEYAHALLHFDVDDITEKTKREVEAEAVAYIVGRYCGLDTSGSAFYLAAWQEDEVETIQERLDRISSTAGKIIEAVD